MKGLIFCLVCLLAGTAVDARTTPAPPTADELSEAFQKAFESYTLKAIETTAGDEVETLKARVATLARQLVMQQLFVEERVRSDGDSGIKQVGNLVRKVLSYNIIEGLFCLCGQQYL